MNADRVIYTLEISISAYSRSKFLAGQLSKAQRSRVRIAPGGAIFSIAAMLIKFLSINLWQLLKTGL